MNKTNILLWTGNIIIIGVLVVNIVNDRNEYNELVERYNKLSSRNQDTVSDYNVLVERFNILNKEKNILETKYSASVETKTRYVTNESCILYNEMHELYYQRPPAGLYMKGTDFYCVWMKDREQSHIEEVESHENAHYQVNQDYQHFCIDAEKEQHKKSCEVLQ